MILVPKEDIEKLEKARILLHEIIKEIGIKKLNYFGVSSTMYDITHKKYQEIDC
jgi:hypothetical protein